jgi:hypothetical protein
MSPTARCNAAESDVGDVVSGPREPERDHVEAPPNIFHPFIHALRIPRAEEKLKQPRPDHLLRLLIVPKHR